MRPFKTKPSTGANQFEGFEQTQQRGEAENALLGSDRATFVRIGEIKAELTSASVVTSPDLKACATLWGEWRSLDAMLSLAAHAYRNAVDLAKLECDERVWHARASYADAEYQAKRSGAGPADDAWAICRAECRQAADDYAAAVTKAKADYRCATQRLAVGRLQSHVPESFADRFEAPGAVRGVA